MHMMQRLRPLTQEVNKVVSAPYSTSLKCLFRVLEQSSSDELHIWSCVKACQVVPLLAKLLECLSTDEYALGILRSLMRSEDVVRALVDYRVQVIEEVLLSEQHSDSQSLCLALFDHPLSNYLPLPSAVTVIVERILYNSCNIPPRTWVHQLMMTLRSCGFEVLAMSSNLAVQACLEQWNALLKSNDNYDFLCCLDIACMVGSDKLSFTSSPTTDLSMSAEVDMLCSWAKKASDLIESKAPRLIRPLLLRALYFVSDKPDVTSDLSLDALFIIVRVLQKVDVNVIQKAMQVTENLEVLAKLCQKMVDADAPALIQLTTFAIIVQFDPTGRHWYASVESIFQSMLITEREYAFVARGAQFIESACLVLQTLMQIDATTAASIKGFNSRIDPFTSIIDFAIDQCMPGKQANADNTLRAEHASVLITALSKSLYLRDGSLVSAPCIATLHIPDWWSMSFTPSRNSDNCAMLETCPQIFETRRQELVTSISSLILHTSCVHGLALGRHNFEQIHEQMARFRGVQNLEACQYAMPHQAIVTSRMSTCFTQTTTLEDELSAVKEQALSAVNEHVNNRCRALEERCFDVEAPLRAERAKLQELEEQLTLLRAQTTQEAVQYHSNCGKLEFQVSSLEGALETAELKLEKMREDLCKEVDQLKQALSEERRTVLALRKDYEVLEDNLLEQVNELEEAKRKEQKLLSVLCVKR